MKLLCLAALVGSGIVLCGCGGSGGSGGIGPFTSISPYAGSWTGNATEQNATVYFDVTVANDGTVTGQVLSASSSEGAVTGSITNIGKFSLTVGSTSLTGAGNEVGTVVINGKGHLIGTGTLTTKGHAYPISFDLTKV